MASRRTYECFVCKRQGYSNVQVYLDGKDDQGHTKYLNEDMTVHKHQGSSSSSSNGSGATVTQSQTQPQPQQQQEQTIPLLKVISAKLDRLVTLLLEGKENEREQK